MYSPLLAALLVAQCPVYQAQWVSGPNCGILGHAGAIGWGLSESGAVCGERGNCQSDARPFRWTPPGGLQSIATPTAFPHGRAVDISSAGTVVGRMDSALQESSHAFIAIGGSAVDLGLLPNTNMAEATAINDLEVVVGYALNTSGPSRAFQWRSTGMEEVIVSAGPNVVAEDVNDLNQICGWMGDYPALDFVAHGFIWSNGATTDLGIPSGATASAANAINNRGDACGFTTWPDTGKAGFVRRPCAWIDGQFIDLGTVDGLAGGLALDISDAREIVGYCTDAYGNPIKPFLWRNGMMYDLTDLVPAGSLQLEIARAINNKGQISGEAYLFNPPDSFGAAFLLTPALPTRPGDTNCDEAVNVNDLLKVINHWNPPGPVGGDPTDLNRDNRIDHLDLLEVIFHWGQ